MDQFGDVLPTGNLTFPIRHAGQYYDAEVNIFYNYFRDYDPITGRYVESDPIGLDGGLNTYGYVSADPLLKVDPKGLVEWTGTMFSLSLLTNKDIYTLRTKCIDGKRGYARVHAILDKLSINLGVTVGGSNVTFEDNLSYVNPNIFNGHYYKTSIGAALGIGYGGSHIQLGGAKTSAGGGLLGGIDVSMAYSFAPGLSTVMEQKVENCDCENK